MQKNLIHYQYKKMVTNKYYIKNQGYTADLSNVNQELYQIVKTELLTCGEKYKVDLQWIADFAEKITAAQLKLWLNRSGKLKPVNEFINQSDNEELKIMWEYATEWHYVNEQLQELAQHFEIDLKEAFRQAAEILV
jgi:hypothetical protein